MKNVISIHPENPQDRLILKIVDVLQNGGVIVYPTDSGYAIGCMLDNKSGLERICAIKNLDKKHNFTLVCPDVSNISLYSNLDNNTFRLIKKYTPGKYTFILKASKEVPRRVMNEKRKTIGVRIPDNIICQTILFELKSPLMSSSLILPNEVEVEHDPYEIEEKIGHAVDLIVDGGYLLETPTTVVDLVDGNIEIIRIGAGDPTPFE